MLIYRYVTLAPSVGGTSGLDLCQAGYDVNEDVNTPEDGGLVEKLVVAVHLVGSPGSG